MRQIIHLWVSNFTIHNIWYISEFLVTMQFPLLCCGVKEGKFGKGMGKEYWRKRLGLPLTEVTRLVGKFAQISFPRASWDFFPRQESICHSHHRLQVPTWGWVDGGGGLGGNVCVCVCACTHAHIYPTSSLLETQKTACWVREICKDSWQKRGHNDDNLH